MIPKRKIQLEGVPMKRLGVRACFLSLIALVLLSFSRPAAAQNQICAQCEAEIIGAAIIVGVAVGVGVGIYLIHRGHTSLTGCVQQTDSRLTLTAKNGNNYELLNAPTEVKAGERFSLRGHMMKGSTGAAFRVNRVSRDYGTCSP
jgi:hypothetical protein